MSHIIDARGLACPAPVLQTKAAIDKDRPQTIRITVDNDAAGQNVTRFLRSQNYHTEVTETGGDTTITGTRDKDAAPAPSPLPDASPTAGSKILVMINTDRMGHGDDVLGRKLMKSFIATLKEMGDDLWRLVLVNSGVKLTIDESPCIAELKDLIENGVSILVCGTCLDYFNLLDEKEVGETTNMLDIMTSLQLAEKVINL